MKPGHQVSLLCLPCGGASAAMYACWRLQLPRWIEVVPVELPGRGARAGEPFSCDFDELVEQLCLEHARALDKPYALFGHSMGGLLAWGMAACVHQRHRRFPLILMTSASPSPSSGWHFPARDNDDALLRDLRHYGGVPEDVFECPEMLRLALDTLAADYVLCNSFRYRGPVRLPIPLRVLAGREDAIALEQLAGWREQTSASFALHWFSGGHFYLRPQQGALLRLIEQELCSAVKALREKTEAPTPALPA